MGQSRLSWIRQLKDPELAGFRIVSFDLRGHGDSDKPDEEAPYADPAKWADDVAAVIAAAGLRRPVLVGWSLGGPVLLSYLQRYGTKNVAGLNLVDAVTAAGPDLLRPEAINFAKQLASEDFAVRTQAIGDFLKACFAVPPPRAELDRMLVFNGMVPRALQTGVLAIARASYDDTITQFDAPLLVTFGAKDLHIFPKMATRVLALNPRAKLSTYPKAGHSPFYEEPERFNRELAAFVRSTVGDKTKNVEAAALPKEVLLREPGLYPEDVEWDSDRQNFLVSSVAHGSITIVGDDGAPKPFISGDGFKSSIGFHIDKARNRLLVAAGDFAALNDVTVKGEAKLAVYDLASGKQQRLIDLAGLRPEGRHLANDVTVDAQGNAYVTDSLSPMIYKITPEGDASVFVEDGRLEGKGVNLNGIAFHPDGYLLVAVGSKKSLYRIPLNAPAQMSQVEVPEAFLADSLTFRPNGNLVVALPFLPGVMELASDDGWHSARVVGRASTFKKATTTSATLRGDVVYGLNSHFDEMDRNEPVQKFEIWKAPIEGLAR